MANQLKVKEIAIKEQLFVDSTAFPLVLGLEKGSDAITSQDCCDWVANNSPKLQQDLLKYGAILFRNFPLPNAEDFDAFVKSFGLSHFPYVGGSAPRKVVAGNVFSSNEAPPSEKIPFHHELAQVPTFPTVLFFYCFIPAKSDGQTPIVHSNMAYTYMSQREPEFVRKLEEEGVRYVRILPPEDDFDSAIGRGWKSTFQTNDKEEAERRATAHGTTFEWLPDGCMKTVTKVLPAIRVDKRTDKKTWFNSINDAYMGWDDSRNSRKKAVMFGNGELMGKKEMDTLQATLDEIAVDFLWEQGDVLMVDNRQALHARRSFTPPRKIFACLCTDE